MCSKVSTASQLDHAQALETKGIDIVRRDWCQLSRDIGQACLKEILSGRDQEDIVEAVHELLRTVHQSVSQGRVELHQFVITKQLTKNPEDYPDAKNQAHVQVVSCTPHGDTMTLLRPFFTAWVPCAARVAAMLVAATQSTLAHAVLLCHVCSITKAHLYSVRQ